MVRYVKVPHPSWVKLILAETSTIDPWLGGDVLYFSVTEFSISWLLSRLKNFSSGGLALLSKNFGRRWRRRLSGGGDSNLRFLSGDGEGRDDRAENAGYSLTLRISLLWRTLESGNSVDRAPPSLSKVATEDDKSCGGYGSSGWEERFFLVRRLLLLVSGGATCSRYGIRSSGHPGWDTVEEIFGLTFEAGCQLKIKTIQWRLWSGTKKSLGMGFFNLGRIPYSSSSSFFLSISATNLLKVLFRSWFLILASSNLDSKSVFVFSLTILGSLAVAAASFFSSSACFCWAIFWDASSCLFSSHSAYHSKVEAKFLNSAAGGRFRLIVLSSIWISRLNREVLNLALSRDAILRLDTLVIRKAYCSGVHGSGFVDRELDALPWLQARIPEHDSSNIHRWDGDWAHIFLIGSFGPAIIVYLLRTQRLTGHGASRSQSR